MKHDPFDMPTEAAYHHAAQQVIASDKFELLAAEHFGEDGTPTDEDMLDLLYARYDYLIGEWL